MKTQIISILCCILCYGAIAQQQPNTIKVTSRVIYVDPEPTYKAQVSISSVSSTYKNYEMTLNELKELFKTTLEKSGLSWENVKEHSGTFGFETLGYQQEGIIYEYQTLSVEEMKKFLNIRMPILQSLNMASWIELDNQEVEKIIQMALDKNYKKAALLAKAMKRKVGSIISASENVGDILSEGKPYPTALYYNREPGEFYYDLTVVFELE